MSTLQDVKKDFHVFKNVAKHTMPVLKMVDWLFWAEILSQRAVKPFETVFQSISDRLPEREGERKEK